MGVAEIAQKLGELRQKQAFILKSWQKAGNKDLLQFFVEIIPKALNAERCGIFILDPVRKDIWIQSGTGLAERDITVPIDTSIVGRVIKTGEAIVEEDLEKTVGSHDVIGVKTGFLARNALCVPVQGAQEGKVIGAIQILNKRGGKYTDEDRATLQRLASLVRLNLEDIFMRQEMLSISELMTREIKLLEKRLAEARR